MKRRDFIKVSSIAVAGGFLPAILPHRRQCPLCKALSFYRDRCFNCGMGLTGGVACKECGRNYGCLEIPFPNRELVRGSNKPSFSLEMINF